MYRIPAVSLVVLKKRLQSTADGRYIEDKQRQERLVAKQLPEETVDTIVR